MKKIIGVTLLSLLPISASANEIPGTRVSGHTVIQCPIGAGQAIEINATTKEKYTYCYELYVPTNDEIQQYQRQQISQAITQQKNSEAPTVNISEIVVAQPVATPSDRPTKMEINVSTGITTINELTDDELHQWLIDKTVLDTQDDARRIARERAEQDAGTEYCVKWETLADQGEECHLTPIPATDDEINNWLAILSILLGQWNFNQWWQ